MFLDKLKRYLRVKDSPQAIKAEYASPRNEYYGKVSERFSIAQTLLYVLPTLVVLISLMINSEWITYENFYYFFSDMGDYITSSDSNIEDVMYSVDRNQSFELYGGKLAVAGNSGFKLYTSSGRLIVDDSEDIGNPKLEASDRYLLMYDSGGTEFRIYNMFTEIFSDHAAGDIFTADVADSGDVVIVTKGDAYNSSIDLYNSKFKLKKSYKLANDYVVDVSLSSNGAKLAVLSYSFNGAEVISKVGITDTSGNGGFNEIKINGSFPLYCEFTSSGRLNVICDDRIVSYEENGREIKEILFGDDGRAVFADMNSDGAAVVVQKNQEYRLIVFDRNGNSVYNDHLSGSTEGIRLYGSFVFVDSDETIMRIDLSSKKVSRVPCRYFGGEMLIKSDQEVLLCLPERVKYIKFE